MIDEQTMLTNCMQCKTVNREDCKHIDFLKSEIEEMSRAKIQSRATSRVPLAACLHLPKFGEIRAAVPLSLRYP